MVIFLGKEADLVELGKTGVKIPPIGMGTWGIGGGMIPDRSKDDWFVKVIKKAIELGMWHIDTAEMYGGGHTEEIVGKAIRDFDREEVFITTKVKGENLSRNRLIKALKGSLERLGVSYVDLYLVHWPNPRVHLSETMKTLEELVDKGYIRFIGVSNFEVKLIEEARSYLSHEDIVNVQNRYSLKYRSDERDVIPYCQREKITYTAYTPLEKGSLARDSFLAEIGKKYGKTAAQVALNWIISHPFMITIPKASNLKHLEENAGAMGWRLNKEDLEKIDKHFKKYI